MQKISRFTKRSGHTKSLNADRGDAWWQDERGPRYGNARKAKSKQKVDGRRKERRRNNNSNNF